MMRWIVQTSMQLRRLVVAAVVGLIVLGAVQVTRTPVDALPEFSPPTVEVQTEALGLSAAEVEELITAPLEQDLLVGVAFLDEIESVSLPGLSSVVMTFEPGTDVLDARQVVQERLTQAVGVAGLPAVAKPPQMIQPLSSTSRVSMIKLTSDSLSQIDVSVLARWVIGPRLLGVPGVANVAIWGNRDRQLQVRVDPERLRDSDVALSQVIRTAGNSLEVSPLSYLEASTPGTGGFIDMPNQRLNIFHEQAISTPEELAEVPLEGPGVGTVAGSGPGPTVLGDVADVVEDHQPLIGDSACTSGDGCLLMVVEKFPGANTHDVAEGVDDALDVLEPGLTGLQVDTSSYQPASYVESAFSNVGWAALAGALLLVLLIGTFIADWRRILIVLTGIASSVAITVVVLNLTDTTVNLVVMCGLVLGVTVLVDDVVCDVDEIVGRVASLRQSETGRPAWAAIAEASVATRTTILYALLIAVAAVVPMFFLEAEAGAFLPPIALAYLLAVAASMTVALTITPALAMILLLHAPPSRRQSPAVGWLRRAYDRFAPRTASRPGPAVGVLVVLVAAGAVSVPFLNTSMRPALQERDVLVHVSSEPGTSLPRMTALTDRVMTDLATLPGVADVNGQVGRAVMSDQDVNVNEGEIWVSVDEDAEYDATVVRIRETVDGSEGLSTEVLTYTEERVEDVLEDGNEDLVVRVYGENDEALTEKAEEIRALLTGTDGVTRARVREVPQESTFEIEADLARTQAAGIKPGDVRRAAASLLGGITVGNLFEEQKVFDVVVWGTPEIRQSQADIENLRIDAPDGRSIRLGDVASVRDVPNAAAIQHESVTKYVEVTADVAGRDVGEVNEAVDTAIKQIDFPLDHHAEVIEGFTERQADRNLLVAVGITAAVVVLLLLQAAFRSWRHAALVLVLLPVSLSGALVATFAVGGEVTLGTVGGCLAVLGLAARWVVALVRHFQYLHLQEDSERGPDEAVRGTGERVGPMVTSVLATAVFLLPIAVLTGPGLELLQPAAVAVLGGLASTLVVSLFILPVMFERLGAGTVRDEWADDLMADVPATDRVGT